MMFLSTTRRTLSALQVKANGDLTMTSSSFQLFYQGTGHFPPKYVGTWQHLVHEASRAACRFFPPFNRGQGFTYPGAFGKM